MKTVDLTITNHSKTESFILLDVELKKDKRLTLKGVPFSRANNLVIAASGLQQIEVSVKGMTSTKQGLVTNELSDLKKQVSTLEADALMLTERDALSTATVAELNVIVEGLASDKAALVEEKAALVAKVAELEKAQAPVAEKDESKPVEKKAAAKKGVK